MPDSAGLIGKRSFEDSSRRSAVPAGQQIRDFPQPQDKAEPHIHGQRDRAIQLQTAVEVARASNKKPLSIAFDEIAKEEVSFDPETIDAANH